MLMRLAYWGPIGWLNNLIFKPAKKNLLLTTTMTIQHPYEELGMATSVPFGAFQVDRERRLRKNALKLYPDADAVIGIIMLAPGVLQGTVVRYRES
jgi:hypothetical protein